MYSLTRSVRINSPEIFRLYSTTGEVKLRKSKSCLIEQHLYICLVSTIKKYRTVITYKNYFEDFLHKQSQKVKDKIFWTFLLIEEIQQIPETYLKHIEGTDGLYEIRIQLSSNIFRIFCFFDEGKLVVLANGFQKKTQKTPRQEINNALKIKEEYYENKK